MIILFCYLVILVIVVTTLTVAAAVIWHEWTKIRAFVTACTLCKGGTSAASAGGVEDEDCPRCGGSGAEPETEPEEDDTEAWDRGHDHDIDRRTGVSP